jgi:hypothetical protein
MTRKRPKPELSRREFLKQAATAAAVAGGVSGTGPRLPAGLGRAAAESGGPPAGHPQRKSGGMAMISVKGNRIQVETKTLTAVIEKGFITSLKSKARGEEFIVGFDPGKGPALELLYRGGETVPVDGSKFGSITCRQLSRQRAEIIFHNWDGDGVIAVSADPETGDLLVSPSAYSSRPGVRACRWTIKGLRKDLQLVAPLFQGVKLKLDDPLIRDGRWTWPISWEAGLAIVQGADSGFWVHTQDDRYRYKALKAGAGSEANAIGLDTEAYGPIDGNLSAGGLCWRVNVYGGEWQVPAAHYRDWLWRRYGLQVEERKRREWIYGIKMAISWCPGDPAVLDALAQKVDPKKVLLHFPNWRTDGYDENYPTYVASESARAFLAKGQAMGFHIMPHFNSVDMDPTHPAYAQLRDFQYRDLEDKRILGWSWHEGRVIGVPESNLSRTQHRDKKVMAKIHPGLSMWRAVLGENILRAVQDLKLDTVFIDVTLTTWNLHNCLVEAMTPTEGMKLLISHVAELSDGLVVGGEGLNEITMQGLSFAQAHLFQSWQATAEGLARTGGCALNDFLFGKLCRTIGYSGLSGKSAEEELRMRIHEEHGAIPTITIHSPEEITNPNPAVKRVLEGAAG